ncbi:hypothetical protein [Tenacibaculum retecalamus]|uniref:hypothetical protein n=1 Tax=Tenacibaculum retecalamus TaxID=3018315 RepID=UPI0023D93059|nr:hypothetical protein [Tenacibaculum retecalamus]WBX71228.1 hypothetical protein PG912_00020 [Tenacibaculum retecalamus]
MENTLGFKLPNNYVILKDTIVGNIDYSVNIEVQFKNKNESKNIIKKLKKDYTFNSVKNGFSFGLESKDYNFYPCSVDIDTLNNTLSFKEFHY